MKSQSIYRSKWAMPTALLIIFAVVGCTGQVNPTLPPAPSPTAEASSPTSDAASSPTPDVASSPTPGSVESTATSQPATNKIPAYQDDFSNPGTGWDAATLGNYFVGYHEGGWYHIAISEPDRVAISEPSKTVYEDATIELQAFAWSTKTAPEGNFRFGLVFRRSGNNYYAFTISPSTKKWELLKVSPDGVTKLKEGDATGIHDRDVDDLLRVDVLGPNFLLYINDSKVDQVIDTSYKSGEVGLYAENIDSPGIHIHYDTFTVRALKLSKTCSVNEGGTVNVRTGPSKTYPQMAVLSSGDIVEALGKSSNQWIEIIVEGSSEPGWVSYSEGYMSCTPSIDLFPVVGP